MLRISAFQGGVRLAGVLRGEDGDSKDPSEELLRRPRGKVEASPQDFPSPLSLGGPALRNPKLILSPYLK